MRSIKRLLFGLSLVGLGACASFEPFAVPDISLVDLRFADLQVFETTGVFTARVSNTNPDPITIDGGVYNLFLNGVKIGRGLSNTRLEIPRLGSATVEVELFINNLALATRIMSILENPRLNYRVKGKFYVERSYGTRRFRFSRAGEFDFTKTRDAAADLSLEEVTEPEFSGIEVKEGD